MAKTLLEWMEDNNITYDEKSNQAKHNGRWTVINNSGCMRKIFLRKRTDETVDEMFRRETETINTMLTKYSVGGGRFQPALDKVNLVTSRNVRIVITEPFKEMVVYD